MLRNDPALQSQYVAPSKEFAGEEDGSQAVISDMQQLFTQFTQKILEATKSKSSITAPDLSRLDIPTELSSHVHELVQSLDGFSGSVAMQRQELAEMEQQIKAKHHIATTAIPESEMSKELAVLNKQVTHQDEQLKRQSQELLDMDEKQANLKKEIARLRHHLAETEDQHTRDLLDLQAQLEHEQNGHISTRSKLETYQAMLHSTDESQQSEIAQLRDFKRQVEVKIVAARQQLDDSRGEADDLRAVLEGFEASKQAELDLVTTELKKQVDALQHALETESKHRQDLQNRWLSIGLSESEVRALKTQCQQQQDIIDNLQKQIANLSTALSSSTFYAAQPGEQSSSITAQSPQSPTTAGSTVLVRTAATPATLIDLSVMCNIIMQYFTCTDSQKRIEILMLLTKILKMTDDQRRQIGLVKDESTGHWRRTSTARRHSSIPGTASGRHNSNNGNNNDSEAKVQESSLTDMWISFLLTESRNRSNHTPSFTDDDEEEELDEGKK